MTKETTHESDNPAGTIDGTRPRYQIIAQQIQKAIESSSLPVGTVLTEDPIARLFRSSRTPVRTALKDLNERGMLDRFDGRGFVVAGADNPGPLRISLTLEMLGLSEGSADDSALLTSERVARNFENDLIQTLPFGEFRISEQAAADHYQVSRTVIRDILARLNVRGIVSKDPRSHWVIGPLTATEVAHYYSIRAKLEPLALIDSAPQTDNSALQSMEERIASAVTSPTDISVERLDELEEDLHVRLLAKSENSHLLRMVHQSQLALVVNHVFATFVGTVPFQDSWSEHALILDFVKRGRYRMAAQALEEHLMMAEERTAKRLMAISVFPQPAAKPYLKRITR
ncbi:regulatory protein, GntR [Rhodobacteraceae bacterium KLH11]|nr:regulatory protein, GntR [Rhodobacteraceae bacterium KLH11]